MRLQLTFKPKEGATKAEFYYLVMQHAATQRLNSTSKDVLTAVIDQSQGESYTANININRLAKHLNRSSRTVMRAIQQLRHANLLRQP